MNLPATFPFDQEDMNVFCFFLQSNGLERDIKVDYVLTSERDLERIVTGNDHHFQVVLFPLQSLM